MKRTALARRSPLRRTRMKRRRGTSKYARRPRDTSFMVFVKTQLCSVEEEWPDADVPPTPCQGAIEADHLGPRGLGQKADDRTCAPMCTLHHRERTDHTGSFRTVTREHERAWRERAVLRTQTLYAEREGLVLV